MRSPTECAAGFVLAIAIIVPADGQVEDDEPGEFIW
jgi:hypothetical protein